MKTVVAVILLLLASGFLLANAIDYVAPEYLQPFCDAYTTNYLNAQATGRGHTGVSDMGGLENVLLNPAAFTLNKASFSLEFMLKTHSDPIIQLDDTDYNNSGTQVYENVLPISFLSIGFVPFKNSSLAFTYSEPQSVYYNSVSIATQTSSSLDRYPELLVHRFTVSGNTQFNRWTVGLAVMDDYYHQNDYQNYYTVDQITTNDHVFRVQPGVHYQNGNFALGITDLLPAKHTFDMHYGETYDLTFPNVVAGGISYRAGAWKFLAESQFEQWKTLSSDMDNRLRLNFGCEHDVGKITYRFGCMSVPGVYSGKINLPTDAYDPLNPSYYAPSSSIATVEDNDQFFLTVGLTFRTKGGAWNLAIASDVLNNVQVNQFQVNYTLEFARLGEMLKDKPRTTPIDTNEGDDEDEE